MYNDKTVIIFGAGGTIGSAVCKSLFNARKVIAVDISEYAIYKLKREEFITQQTNVTYIVGDAANTQFCKLLIESEPSVDVVINAAAYKHVDILGK